MSGEIDEEDLWMHLEASKKNTGRFASRIYVQPLGGSMVRINFGEVIDDLDPSYHTSIVVTAQQAVAFAQIIYNVGNATLTAEAEQWAQEARVAAEDAAAAAQEAVRSVSEADGN